MSIQTQEQDFVPTFCTVESIFPQTAIETTYRIRLPGGRVLGHKPGQFVQISIMGVGEAPISISSSPTRGDWFDLTVRKIGRVTSAIHGLKVGDKVGIRGPFGSFVDMEALYGRSLLMIAGGCGLAPLRSVIQYAIDKKEKFKKLSVLYGAKTPDDVMFRDETEKWKNALSFDSTVDFGNQNWKGNVGQITGLVRPLSIDRDTVAIIVGPPVMYKYVIQELDKKGMTSDNIIVSLERYMKCGIGKCGHCTIEHLYCCTDGPVFWLKDVMNLKGAL
ncbi:MAG: oxidoreductase [Bdellovibrionales bacterium RIFOXYD1_FULL_53_11]|nr:MAG: oxidoreductase [Bdellovibrionales bacterium RIFOXYD1_FULL_53_11]